MPQDDRHTGRRTGSRRAGASRRGADPDDQASRLAAPLRQVLQRLPEVERRVLEFRMGLVDGHPHAVGETASEFGLTVAEARAIEQRAFDRIREVVPLDQLQRLLGDGP